MEKIYHESLVSSPENINIDRISVRNIYHQEILTYDTGLAISYSSLLRHEASLARTVLSAGRRDGVFIPRRLKKGLLVHFAIDIDFQEDTVDGKGTFHGTVTVAFQPGPSSPSELEPLKFHSDAVEPLPAAIYEVSPCPMNRSL